MTDLYDLPCPHRGEGGGIGGQMVTEHTCRVCGLAWLGSSTAASHPHEGTIPRLTVDAVLATLSAAGPVLVIDGNAVRAEMVTHDAQMFNRVRYVEVDPPEGEAS